jgi:hypothetical protein
MRRILCRVSRIFSPFPLWNGGTRIIVGTLFALLVGLAGCSPSTHDVTGQVKYNGALLDKPGGQVVFVGTKGTQIAAEIGPDGVYRASKVPAGLNRVVVYWPNPEAQNKPNAKSKKPPAKEALPPPFLTPKKYASVDTSELSVQVADGTVFNIELMGPPIP